MSFYTLYLYYTWVDTVIDMYNHVKIAIKVTKLSNRISSICIFVAILKKLILFTNHTWPSNDTAIFSMIVLNQFVFTCDICKILESVYYHWLHKSKTLKYIEGNKTRLPTMYVENLLCLYLKIYLNRIMFYFKISIRDQVVAINFQFVSTCVSDLIGCCTFHSGEMNVDQPKRVYICKWYRSVNKYT